MAEELIVETEEKTEIGFKTFDEALKNEDFSKSLKSYVDSAVSKGVETYKKGSFHEAVEKGVADKIEAAKHKSPEQLQMIEMAKTMEDMKNELANERKAKSISTNKNLALKGLTDKGMPSGLVDYIVSDTEEATLKNLDSISKVISDFQQGLKTEQLRNNNIIVPSKDGKTTTTLKEPNENASKEEWKTYWANQKG